MLNLNEVDIPSTFVNFFNTEFDPLSKIQYFMDSCHNLEKDAAEQAETAYNKEHLSRSVGHMLIFLTACCAEYGITAEDIQPFILQKINRLEQSKNLENELKTASTFG